MEDTTDLRRLAFHGDHLAANWYNLDVKPNRFKQRARPRASGDNDCARFVTLAAARDSGDSAVVGCECGHFRSFYDLDTHTLHSNFKRVHQTAILDLMFLREENGSGGPFRDCGLELA